MRGGGEKKDKEKEKERKKGKKKKKKKRIEKKEKQPTCFSIPNNRNLKILRGLVSQNKFRFPVFSFIFFQ